MPTSFYLARAGLRSRRADKVGARSGLAAKRINGEGGGHTPPRSRTAGLAASLSAEIRPYARKRKVERKFTQLRTVLCSTRHQNVRPTDAARYHLPQR